MNISDMPRLDLEQYVHRVIAERDNLRAALRFIIDAANTEPAMGIYRAHIEQAETLLTKTRPAPR